MPQRIPPDALAVMLSDPSDFGSTLRHAIEHCERCIVAQEPQGRFDALGAHAPWFADRFSSLEWLELLWTSTERAPRRRRELLRVMSYAIRGLPPLMAETSAEREGLLLAAPVFLLFARMHHVPEVLAPLRLKAFGSIGWLHDPKLRAGLLLAAYANNYAHEAFDFLDQMVRERDFLPLLGRRQLAVFCVEYLASARQSFFSTDQPEESGAVLPQLDELINQAYADSDRPDPLVEQMDGFADQIRDAITEVLVGILLPPDLHDRIVRLQTTLQEPERTPDVLSEASELFASFRQKLAAGRGVEKRAQAPLPAPNTTSPGDLS